MSATDPMPSSALSSDAAHGLSADQGGLPVPVLVLWATLFALTFFYLGQCYWPAAALHS